MAHFVIDKTEKRARRASLEIANGFLHEEITPYRAIEKLKKVGLPISLLFAGEIAIESAHSDSPTLATSWLRYAKQHLDTAVDKAKDPDHYDPSSQLRALVKKAHLKPYAHVLTHDTLPGAGLVTPMYDRLIQIGRSFSQITPEEMQEISEDSRIEIAGTLGELAVLLLGQRYALNTIGCNTWLPMQSKFSEDHGGDCLNHTDEFTWDIGIHTHTAPEPIEQSYAVQIKTSDTNTDLAPGPGVLFISPDLALYPGEKIIPRIIITSCFYEQDPTINHDRISADLDARTEKFLDCLDR